jgi:hypothetical protein
MHMQEKKGIFFMAILYKILINKYKHSYLLKYFQLIVWISNMITAILQKNIWTQKTDINRWRNKVVEELYFINYLILYILILYNVDIISVLI